MRVIWASKYGGSPPDARTRRRPWSRPAAIRRN